MDEMYKKAIRCAASSERAFINSYENIMSGAYKDDGSTLDHYSTIAKAEEHLISELFEVPLYEVERDVLAALLR